MDQSLLAMLHEIQRAGNDLRDQMTGLRGEMGALRRDFEEALGGDFRTAKDGLVAKVDRVQRCSDEVLERLQSVESEMNKNRELRGALKEQVEILASRLDRKDGAIRSIKHDILKSAIATTVPVLLLSLLVGAVWLLQHKFL